MNMIESRMEQRGQGGFTLIELLVVVAILAVLGGAAIIGIGAMRGSAEKEVCSTDKETIETALEAEKLATNDTAYATAMSDLTGPGYLKDAPKGTWDITTTPGEAVATAYGSLNSTELAACNA